LAVATTDEALHRVGADDLAHPFLGARFGFRDFSMERVGMVLGFLWFAAPELALARPKAPHIAGRALSSPAGGQVHRPMPIAMRPLRQKSSRIRRVRRV
jgi:hypothetical protein